MDYLNSKMNHLMDRLAELTVKPRLFEPGEPLFWNDPHISKGMLKAHLDPTHDAASRRPEVIDLTVKHLLDSGVLKPGMTLLDLGCGPGYTPKGFARPGSMSRALTYRNGPFNTRRNAHPV